MRSMRGLVRTRTMAGLLEGHLAVVTGSGSGIGHAIALGYAREGAQIVALDIDGNSAAESAIVDGRLPRRSRTRSVAARLSSTMPGSTGEMRLPPTGER